MGLFGKLIYSTDEYKGYGKQNYYNNDYYQDGDEVTKVKHNRCKVFNGDENEWVESDNVIEKWKIDSPDMPEWLHKYTDD